MHHFSYRSLFLVSGLLAVSCRFLPPRERPFPLALARESTSVRLDGSQDISDPAVLKRLLSIAEQYDSWPSIPECDSCDCRGQAVEWVRDGRVQVTLHVCRSATQVQVGECGWDSPCGRHVPAQAGVPRIQWTGTRRGFRAASNCSGLKPPRWQ